LTTTFYVDREN
jgi:hypothetical protein